MRQKKRDLKSRSGGLHEKKKEDKEKRQRKTRKQFTRRKSHTQAR